MIGRKHGTRRRFNAGALQLSIPSAQPLALGPAPAGDPPVCDLDILLRVRSAAKKEALPMGPATGLVR